MLALQHKCVNAASQKPYIKSFSGGRNNSNEGHAVRTCTSDDAHVKANKYLKSPYTHGFVVEFESEEDRDYYVNKDPAHQEFISFAGELLQNVKVLDYEPGKL
jgi:hypothetical protein